MIDFRYHLVSIVSVFIALAVGIVLGAGPLKGQLGDTLTQEVTQLREDRAALRTELDATTSAAKTRDEFTEAAMPRLLSGTLAAKKVTLIALPGADRDDVAAVGDALGAAGSTVVSRVTVSEAWVSTEDAAQRQRDSLATGLRASLTLPAADAGDRAALDAVLATALVAKKGVAGTEATRRALEALVDAKLIEANTADLVRGQAAVLVAAPIQGEDKGIRDESAKFFARLALAMDQSGDGAVLASNVALASDANESASVVQAARIDSTIARNLSTVDNISLAMGQVSVAYALVQQFTGGAGQYGIGDNVTGGYPPVPAR